MYLDYFFSNLLYKIIIFYHNLKIEYKLIIFITIIKNEDKIRRNLKFYSSFLFM